MDKIITQKDISKTIIIRNGKEVVRSDKLALIFERTHKQVLALIKKKSKFMEGNDISLREYFISETATKIQGGSFTRYYLTRKGFDYIALSLQGRNAELHKLWYIDEFHKRGETIREHKELAIKHSLDEQWIIFREEGKVFRTKLTDAIRDTVIAEREKESKFNDGKYYHHYTNLIYKKLGIDLPKGANPRDVLDKRMLVRLEDMEDKIATRIIELSEKKHYKEVYQTIKTQLGDTDAI